MTRWYQWFLLVGVIFLSACSGTYRATTEEETGPVTMSRGYMVEDNIYDNRLVVHAFSNHTNQAIDAPIDNASQLFPDAHWIKANFLIYLSSAVQANPQITIEKIFLKYDDQLVLLKKDPITIEPLYKGVEKIELLNKFAISEQPSFGLMFIYKAQGQRYSEHVELKRLSTREFKAIKGKRKDWGYFWN